MSKIIVDSGISLDGFFAGNDRGPKNPMGGVSAKIHAWMFKQTAFWKHINMDGGEEYGHDSELIDRVFERTGAYIMGKRMFDEGEVSWKEDVFKADVFVLTNQLREPWIQTGNTRFYFINDGIDRALELAKNAANGKDIRIQGGANTIQQFLNAGVVDEMFIHIAPVFLGSGIRLFEAIDPEIYDLQILEVIPSALTTHIRYSLKHKLAKRH
ncbi:MAG: dihydrofolate reductase family protein [Flavitalea sp.]